MKKLSFYALIISITIISIYRVSNISEKEIAWDILGYYMPLPATFIHHDPLLNDISWLKKVNEEKDLTGTLYMVSSNDEGEPMYFFFFGMSIFYLPSFLIGHLIALFSHYPTDGFSSPYQLSLVIGAIIYTIIGLCFFRKILNKYFSDSTSAVVLLVTVFATNYINHLTLINLEPVNVLFMLVSIVLWYTIKWHEKQRLKYILIIVSSISLIAMVKPSEVIILFIPLLWGVTSIKSAIRKIELIFRNRKQFIIAFFIALLIVSPQIIYWYLKTGLPFYDTYKNPGVGLDFSSPHIFNVLFSYRKGWLLYTPVMIFYLLGFIFLYKKSKGIFLPSIVYFLLSFYIISSWSEWWYGAGFSIRPLITIYPVLALGFGYLLEYIWTKNKYVKISFLLVLLLLTLLNQFQWWQYKEYIIHPFRTTKESYQAVFLSTSINQQQQELLSVERDFSGKMEFKNKYNYTTTILISEDFEHEDLSNNYIKSDSINKYYYIENNEEFALTKRIKFNKLTDKDHAWIVIRYRYKNDDTLNNQPFLVVTMQHKEKNYSYYAFDVKHDTAKNGWYENEFEYLTPVARHLDDELLLYFWNRDKTSFGIDDFEIEVFEKKDKK
ncbi:MAG: hypothetical protein DRI84_03530 [Bacteroidetes bacterium]|nr:MAG: hypothetical protein DRI84_03530 [Bacteroidota bacterium]